MGCAFHLAASAGATTAPPRLSYSLHAIEPPPPLPTPPPLLRTFFYSCTSCFHSAALAHFITMGIMKPIIHSSRGGQLGPPYIICPFPPTVRYSTGKGAK